MDNLGNCCGSSEDADRSMRSFYTILCTNKIYPSWGGFHFNEDFTKAKVHAIIYYKNNFSNYV